MGNLIECISGADRAVTLTLKDASGSAITSYTDLATLAATVWPGDDQPASFSPTATWLDAAAGTVSLTFAAADTASLTPGDYPVLLAITASSQTASQIVTTLRILAAPGSGTAAPVYGTYDEMLLYASWMARLQSASDQAGFREQRARARTWLDDMIVARWKGQTGGWFSGSTNTAYWTYATLGGVDAIPSKWLRDQLATNVLIIRDDIKEIVAKKAISFTCSAQLGALDKTPYQDLAYQYERQANALVKCCRCELDFNGDGWPDLIINLGATNIR